MVFRICGKHDHSIIAPAIDNLFHVSESKQMTDINKYLYMVSVRVVTIDDRTLWKSRSYHALHGAMYQTLHGIAARFDRGEFRSIEISIDATSDPWFS
jgi:hypothetical protein